MATTTPTSNAGSGVLVQNTAWGYVLLPDDHPGVQLAWDSLLQASTVPWDVLADMASLAGHTADDLVIVGGAAAPLLRQVHEALIAQAVAHMRTR